MGHSHGSKVIQDNDRSRQLEDWSKCGSPQKVWRNVQGGDKNAKEWNSLKDKNMLHENRDVMVWKILMGDKENAS